MMDAGWALTSNILGLIWPIWTAIKQKHYVKRSDAVLCGLSLIIIASGLLSEKPELKLWQLPLYAYPLIQGIFGIGLVVKRERLGLQILSGWATALMGVIVLVTQFS